MLNISGRLSVRYSSVMSVYMFMFWNVDDVISWLVCVIFVMVIVDVIDEFFSSIMSVLLYGGSVM